MQRATDPPPIELVRAAQAGDVEATDQLARYEQEHVLRIATVAVRVLYLRDSANDLANSAWIRILLSIGQLESPAKFREWSSKVVWNTAKNMAARSDPALPSTPALDEAEEPSHWDEEERWLVTASVRAWMLDLPFEDGLIIYLKMVEERTWDQIADEVSYHTDRAMSRDQCQYRYQKILRQATRGLGWIQETGDGL